MSQSIVLCAFALLLYTPLAYVTDRWVYRRNQERRKKQQPGRMTARCFTVGPLQENCWIVARRRAGDRRRPRRRGAAADRRARRPRARDRGDPPHPHALRPRRRGRARSRATPARRSTARRSRCRCWPTSTATSFPGYGPFESYDADHTLDGGEQLQLAGLDIDVIFTPGPQPRPRQLQHRRARAAAVRRRALPGLGRPHRPARRRPRHAAELDRHAARTRCPTRPACSPATWAPRRWGASGPRTRSCTSSPVERQDPDTPRHVGRAGRRRARPRAARAARQAHPRARRLRAHRDADLRGDRAVRARRRRVDRRRPEGDVHVRRRRRELAHAAPRGHRAGLPRLPRARHAQAPAAGEALVPRPVLPRRAPAARAATASSGRSALEAIGSDDPAVDAEAIVLLAELLEARRGPGRAAADLQPRHARHARRLHDRAAGLPARARARPARARCATGSTSTRCARSTPTTPAPSA